jgi:hypothetical protein
MTTLTKRQQKTKQFLGDEDETPEKAPAITNRLPWETGEEYKRFRIWLSCSPRSVREAYRRWCLAGGKTPKKDPPGAWFQLSHGEYLAFRQADQRLAAIEKAELNHKRLVDWESIEAIVHQAIADGELPEAYQDPMFGEIMTDLKIIEVGFMSLEINLNGEPKPGKLPWVERSDQDQKSKSEDARKTQVVQGFGDFSRKTATEKSS